jgi:hypothetical protein
MTHNEFLFWVYSRISQKKKKKNVKFKFFKILVRRQLVKKTGMAGRRSSLKLSPNIQFVVDVVVVVVVACRPHSRKNTHVHTEKHFCHHNKNNYNLISMIECVKNGWIEKTHTHTHTQIVTILFCLCRRPASDGRQC